MSGAETWKKGVDYSSFRQKLTRLLKKDRSSKNFIETSLFPGKTVPVHLRNASQEDCAAIREFIKVYNRTDEIKFQFASYLLTHFIQSIDIENYIFEYGKKYQQIVRDGISDYYHWDYLSRTEKYHRYLRLCIDAERVVEKKAWHDNSFILGSELKYSKSDKDLIEDYGFDNFLYYLRFSSTMKDYDTKTDIGKYFEKVNNLVKLGLAVFNSWQGTFTLPSRKGKQEYHIERYYQLLSLPDRYQDIELESTRFRWELYLKLYDIFSLLYDFQHDYKVNKDIIARLAPFLSYWWDKESEKH